MQTKKKETLLKALEKLFKVVLPQTNLEEKGNPSILNNNFSLKIDLFFLKVNNASVK